MEQTRDEIRSLSVLVIDDEDGFRSLLREVLLDDGFKVHESASGELAIEAMRESQFDMVILDYRMPGISGLDVLQCMRDQNVDVPVIMATGAGSEPIAVEAMKLGAYDYLRKDQLDITRLSILIHGVYERYLFRKAREHRFAVAEERTKSLVAIEAFHSALASLSQFVNQTLQMSATQVTTIREELRPFVSTEGQGKLDASFQQMTQQYAALASAIKTMLRSANMLHGNFTHVNYADAVQQSVIENMKTIHAHDETPEIASEHRVA